MKIFKRDKPLCEVEVCDIPLPDDPAIVVLGDHEFKVCDNCAKLMGVLLDKYEEMEQDRIENESL